MKLTISGQKGSGAYYVFFFSGRGNFIRSLASALLSPGHRIKQVLAPDKGLLNNILYISLRRQNSQIIVCLCFLSAANLVPFFLLSHAYKEIWSFSNEIGPVGNNCAHVMSLMRAGLFLWGRSIFAAGLN